MQRIKMNRSFFTRVLVLIAALWLPVQATAAASISLCPTAVGDAAKNMSADGAQNECQHRPANNFGSTACKLCFSCSFCPASFVEDVHSSLALKPTLVFGLQTAWSLVTFLTTPPEHPPHS